MTEKQLIEEFVLISTMYNPKITFDYDELRFGKWKLRINLGSVILEFFRQNSNIEAPSRIYNLNINGLDEISVIDLQGYLILRILYGHSPLRLYLNGEYEVYLK